MALEDLINDRKLGESFYNQKIEYMVYLMEYNLLRIFKIPEQSPKMHIANHATHSTVSDGCIWNVASLSCAIDSELLRLV